jgi:hypothetical protein
MLMKNKIYFLLLLNNFSTSRDNQKLIKKQTFKKVNEDSSKVNKDSSNSYIWIILGIVGAIILILFNKNKIIEFKDSIFKKNTKSDTNSKSDTDPKSDTSIKYKLTLNITDYKIIDYNNKNLINLNDFKNKNTEISKNQLKKICEEYIKYIDTLNKQPIITYDEAVLISNYYDDLETLFNNIFNNDKNNNFIKIIEGSDYSDTGNAILRAFVGNNKVNKTNLLANIRIQGIKRILNTLNLLKEHLDS